METEDHAGARMLNTLWSLVFQSTDHLLDQLNLTDHKYSLFEMDKIVHMSCMFFCRFKEYIHKCYT